jgi:uncharacterized alpha-E superfamily protein
MLSRIAESLYWIGRYVERAEDTARLLDVAHRSALEGADLLTPEVLGAALGGNTLPGTATEVLSSYCLDRYLPESVTYSVRSARENARTIREALPSEMWEALNTWHLQTAAAGRSDLSGGGAHQLLSDYVVRAYHLMGVAEGTMIRDEGWDWLVIGRYLERVAFTARVLAVRAPQLAATGGAAEAYGYAVLLRAFSAYEAFRTTYRAGADMRRAIEFMLLDDEFPRSTLYAVQRLDEAAGRVSDNRYGLGARKQVGRLRGEMQFRGVDDVLAEGVDTVLWRLLGRCFDVHNAFVEEPFARGSYLGRAEA